MVKKKTSKKKPAKKVSSKKAGKKSVKAKKAKSAARSQKNKQPLGKLLGLIVAIDGPAGSGKSTVTHLVARRLGYTHIDTGALYRAIALRAMEQGVSLDDGEALGRIAENARLEFRWIGDRNHIFLDGEDVSSFIRTPEISAAASTVSAHPHVRQALLGLQRRMGEAGAVVLEGRDIGTVVFPNAHVKFFLTASVEIRAQRRMAELEAKGIYQSFDEVKRQVVMRDKADSERKVAPLKKAADARVVDSTDLSVDDVVDNMVSIVRQKQAKLVNA